MRALILLSFIAIILSACGADGESPLPPLDSDSIFGDTDEESQDSPSGSEGGSDDEEGSPDSPSGSEGGSGDDEDSPDSPADSDSASNGSIAFTDLVSGPASGLGDGKGSGVIVTIWGWFGSQNAGDQVQYCDQSNNCSDGYVYYWKDADGELPSGPANLYASHKLQEVAFSIPASAPEGTGEIRVASGEKISTIPFTVREGNIFHVRSSGDNDNPGSFDLPFATTSHAINNTPAGSTIYVHDVDTSADGNGRAIFKKSNTPNSTLEAQIALLAYPGYQPSYIASQGIQGYRQDAMVIAKSIIRASNRIEINSGQLGSGTGSGATFAIKATAYGRAVANKISDIDSQCASKTQGAIYTSADFYDYASDFRVYGNEIYDYGCAGSSKLHHTTYFTLRSNPDTDGPQDLQALPPHVQFNYLHGNQAKNGIHFHDQGASCGNYTSDVHINNNVIVNQSGAAITYQSSGCDRDEDVHIYNNVILNPGLPADWDGNDPDTSNGHDGNGITIWDSGLSGEMQIHHNVILGWNRDALNSGSGCFGFRGSQDGVKVEFNSNICLALFDRKFIGIGYQSESKSDNIFGSNNIFYYSANLIHPEVFNEAVPSGVELEDDPQVPVAAQPPSSPNLQNSLLVNPLLGIEGVIVSIDDESPAKAQSVVPIVLDVYGNTRSDLRTIGAVE